MKQSDKDILLSMQEMVLPYLKGNKPPIGEADKISILRDMLKFDDPQWYQKLTSCLINLDSASTFYPINDEQNEILFSVVKKSAEEIIFLLRKKLEIE